MSEYPENITKALIAFHGMVPTIDKDAKGQRSKYATLGNILSIVTPVLNKCGMVLTQEFLEDSLITTLRHVSGETISSSCTLAIPSGPHATQAWGSAVTYQRRYAVCAILSLVAEMDEQNDPDAIQPEPAKPKSKPKPAAKNPVAKKAAAPVADPADQPLMKEEVDAILEILIGVRKEDMSKFEKIQKEFLSHFKIASDCRLSESITTHAHLSFLNERI